MTVIELPDHEAAALRARAASQGLSLEAWLRSLAADGEPSRTPQSKREAVSRIREFQKRVKPDPEGWTIRDYINRDRP